MRQEPARQGIEKYIGKDLMSDDGEKVGTIDEFLKHRVTDVPEWIVVETGFLAGRKLVVPLAGSSFAEGHVEVPYPVNVIKEQPEVEAGETLPPEAESMLSAYFGLGASPEQADTSSL